MSHAHPHPRSIDEHLTAVLALARPAPVPVTAPVAGSRGRVLAAAATAALAVPPFSNSAMDGFLVRDEDLPGDGPWILPVAGDVPAGARAVAVPPGAAVRVMTGAPVGDPVADGLRVIPVEDTSVPPGPVPLPAEVTVHRVQPGRRHIRAAGENISPGDVVVPVGTRIDAGTIAALISAGVDAVRVHPLPRVAVISSGDELVDAGVRPGPGQIPDSNRPMLAALLAEKGVVDVTTAHVDDHADADGGLAAELARAARDHDLVITTGGVSVGAFDVVREVTSGGDMWFGSVAQKPGGPQGAGTWEGTPLVCLPGNPVAAWVSFHLYVSPLLAALSGSGVAPSLWARPHLNAAAGRDFPMARGRTALVPVRLDWSAGGAVAEPFTPRGTGSHLVASLAGVDGIAVLDPGVPGLTAGQPVPVLLLT